MKILSMTLCAIGLASLGGCDTAELPPTGGESSDAPVAALPDATGPVDQPADPRDGSAPSDLGEVSGTPSTTDDVTPADTASNGATDTSGADGAPADVPAADVAIAEDTDAVDQPSPIDDFSLVDVNPTSPTFDQPVSPRDYLQQVSGWYFGHAT